MATKKISRIGPCNPACTRTIKFMTEREVPPSVGISLPPYKKVDGYRFINIFVQFSQKEPDEAPVDLGVIFALDKGGKLGARRYVNLEDNLPRPQSTNFVDISGSGSWHGSPHNISSYVARFPIMGPYVQVFIYNREAATRIVSVWGYLVS